MFLHTFQLRLRPDVSEADVAGALQGILALQAQIPGLLQTYVGRNVSPRGNGFGLGGVMHFDDAAGFEAYNVHPAHLALLGKLQPLMVEAVEVDFTPELAAGAAAGEDMAL